MGLRSRLTSTSRLNEVQFPKKLRLRIPGVLDVQRQASMKCSSRGNCDNGRVGAGQLRDVPQ